MVVVSVDSVFVSVLTPGAAASALVSAAVAAVVKEVSLLGFERIAEVSGVGDAAGTTTSVFCSHAPRRAALARMQNNFFIVWD